jgi:hypothetical protein
MKKRKTDDHSNTKQPLEDADPEFDDVSELEGFGRSRTACVCPMCGKMHAMKIRWVGRGVPRKFCPHCRDRETPYEEED